MVRFSAIREYDLEAEEEVWNFDSDQRVKNRLDSWLRLFGEKVSILVKLWKLLVKPRNDTREGVVGELWERVEWYDASWYEMGVTLLPLTLT